jgi:hypothetical protein
MQFGDSLMTSGIGTKEKLVFLILQDYYLLQVKKIQGKYRQVTSLLKYGREGQWVLSKQV